MNKYTYALCERPPGPGCQPMEGLISVSMEPKRYGSLFAWGTATYNRELTDQEKEDYEMTNVSIFLGGKTE